MQLYSNIIIHNLHSVLLNTEVLTRERDVTAPGKRLTAIEHSHALMNNAARSKRSEGRNEFRKCQQILVNDRLAYRKVSGAEQ